jgi:hypothetical protein
MQLLKQIKKGGENVKRTLILMTVLNMLMMVAGVSVALADSVKTLVVTPEPTSILLVLAGLLGIAGISRRKKK